MTSPWTEPSSWSWNNQDLSDEETFARLTHESSDGSESNGDPPPVPPGLPSIISVTVYRYKLFVKLVRVQKICPQKVKRTGCEHAGEPVEVPSSADQVPAPMQRLVREVVHPVQYGIVPERITLPRPDDEILSGHDEDVSSIRRIAELGFALMRHLVTSGSAKPVFRGAHDRRHFPPKPEYRFDNNVPHASAY